MNFFTKIHELFRQKEKIVKKPQKHDANLQKNSTLYFQVGLIICLLTINALFEIYFETKIPKPVLPDPGLSEVTYIVPPKIYKEPVAMVKPKPKPEFKPRRLADKVKVVTNETTLKEEVKPEVFDPIVKTNTVIPTPTKPTVKNEAGPRSINEVSQVPIFPGCEGLSSNDERLKCMSEKLNRLIQRKFDGDIVIDKGLSGKQRIDVQFTIDKSGNVTDIITRSKEKALANEASRVMKKVPQMQPGKNENKEVSVMYYLPIIFQVQ